MEAWNLFGRSEPALSNAYGPTLAMCPRHSFGAGLVPPILTQLFEPVVRWGYWLCQVMWPVFGLVTALMRIRRNSPNRRGKADRSMDNWSWRVLALMSRFIPYGHSLIPPSLRTDPGDTYTVSNTGSVSPAALGTAGMDNVLGTLGAVSRRPTHRCLPPATHHPPPIAHRPPSTTLAPEMSRSLSRNVSHTKLARR